MEHSMDQLQGRILYTPHPLRADFREGDEDSNFSALTGPPPLKIPFQGWGGYKRGGRIKFLPRGGSEYTPPPPSPEKCLLARKGGRGGGGI